MSGAYENIFEHRTNIPAFSCCGFCVGGHAACRRRAEHVIFVFGSCFWTKEQHTRYST
eukprot:m.168321 g.168321  ORF g.168321 m.168321 type:complete len:58 (+) comp21158_c0_seq4:68-241(+)